MSLIEYSTELSVEVSVTVVHNVEIEGVEAFIYAIGILASGNPFKRRPHQPDPPNFDEQPLAYDCPSFIA